MEPLAQKRIRRLLEKVAENPKNCKFENLARLLEAVGFEHRTTRGSHHYFKRGLLRIPVPFRRPLKEHYVNEALKLVRQVLSEEVK